MGARTTARTAPKTGRDVTSELEYLTRALKAPTLRESVARLAERMPARRIRRDGFSACRLVAASQVGQSILESARSPWVSSS